MIKRVVFIFVLMISGFAFAQNYQKHKVEKGETITQIAQKYNVTPYDIYQLNPDVQNGLKPRSIILIPNKSASPKKTVAVKTHKVLTKETLFGIGKMYGVTDEALKKANPFLEKDGLQIGQILTIPSVTASKTAIPNSDTAVYHEVLPKETKYSISLKYGVTIEELEKKNPEIIPNLTVGYKLLIKGTPSKADKAATKNEATANYVNYEVKPKETLYSLSKLAGLSQDELVKLNPALANGVEIGMILKFPANRTISADTKKTISALTNNSTSSTRKKMALVLPFNLSKIEEDTVNSTSARLKKDKFLNMTLDFYAGALIAIDSAKVLGIPVDVKIFDSQETKNTSNMSSIIGENNLQSADAVIGPFYQTNAETTAQLLSSTNVAVISPLSKDIGNAYPNLYQTIPTADVLKTGIFDYMRSKGGNIIDIIDKKKESSRQYILQNQKEVKIVPLLENGNLSPQDLQSLFVKNRINYVILETGNTVMIKAAIKTMVDALPNYNLQLVILESNETLDTDEIKFENLVLLKLMYPSISRENESREALIFENEFRKKNKIFPNSYATRGFDVTFDTMMRLAQDKTYQETLESNATEQVDNKFEFYKKEDGGYSNKGFYILYYDSDLTIKEAN